MGQTGIVNLLKGRIPETAIPYCLRLWEAYPFQFKLRKNRQTKVGDFTCRHGQTPRITVNEDLHPYLFLITYIHEVAHLLVHQQHGHRAEAHGTEWKLQFKALMRPVMTPEFFPPELLKGLEVHMADPMASTFSDPVITRLLRQYDLRASRTALLSDLPEGTIFAINGRWFKKGKLRRTRVLCKEVNSSRSYLVPVDAPVENAQLSLL